MESFPLEGLNDPGIQMKAESRLTLVLSSRDESNTKNKIMKEKKDKN